MTFLMWGQIFILSPQEVGNYSQTTDVGILEQSQNKA